MVWLWPIAFAGGWPFKGIPRWIEKPSWNFFKKVEERVSKDAIERFYSIVKPMIKGNRWYDHDPTLSLTIELLRVVPRDIQRQAANNFIQILQAHGVNVEKAE